MQWIAGECFEPEIPAWLEAKIELLSSPAKAWSVCPHEDFEPGEKNAKTEPNLEVEETRHFAEMWKQCETSFEGVTMGV
jgi:hypothetical protein